ncbi:unnamed protein product [Calicophoron daubneyi]|uniref:Peptidase S54 rhomboid domain-containing protein n=1 Tax=Calicophoron daubneyi TaxID=300641 RepID=A0AAV2T2X5_CALDB
MVRSQIVHLFSNRILYYLTDDEVYAADCFIGISGLVFALNVITCLATDGSFDLTLPVMGEFHIKKSVLAWLDLLLIQFPLPTSSFVGHVAGALAGLSYQRAFFERYGTIHTLDSSTTSETDTGESSS